jgi:hypothetical protein
MIDFPDVDAKQISTHSGVIQYVLVNQDRGSD